MTGLWVLLAVVAAAASYGAWQRARGGRVRAVAAAAPEAAVLAGLGVDPAAARLTLLQFSSAFCAPCRATRVVLADVAAATEGVRHVEVDAESHLDAVRALGVAKTPTTLLVDSAGRVAHRAVGAPRRPDVLAAVAALLDRPDGETA